VVVVPAAIRERIAAHAHEEAPNESCGLLLLDGGRAVEYVPATNASASPYRFELYLDPERWADIGDTDLEQAVVHSHLSSPPRPSRTDVENIGLWEGRPYLIYGVRDDSLAAWKIGGGGIESLQLVVAD
jgi:proteasome lid subunit RPN8/RPN11